MLVYAVETTKFIAAWTNYKAAVRTLAVSTASDPELGDSLFVSSTRIEADLNRLSWNSTTPYLSVLLAPGFAPTRLVVDPAANYFWLSCKTAAANLEADRAVAEQGRGSFALMRACIASLLRPTRRLHAYTPPSVHRILTLHGCQSASQKNRRDQRGSTTVR
jgi:hypothetical protein